MAWFDIVGGLARGAQQGIGQFQQQQQQARENALKDALEKRTQAAFQRQEAEEARTLMLDEMSRQDPDNLDPAWVASKGAAIAPYVQKRPDGTLAVRRDPLAEARRRHELAVAADAPEELAEKIAARGTTRATRERVAQAQRAWDQPTLTARDAIRYGSLLDQDPAAIAARISNPREREAYLESTTQGIGAGIARRTAAATQQQQAIENAANNARALAIANINAGQDREQALQTAIVGLAKEIMNDGDVTAPDAMAQARALLIPGAPRTGLAPIRYDMSGKVIP